MLFKKFTAGTESYGTNLTPTEQQLPNVEFYDANFDRVLVEGDK